MIIRYYIGKIGVLFLVVVLCGCNSSDDAGQDVEITINPAEEVASNVEMHYSQDGKVKLTLTAPTMIRHKTEEPFIEFPNGVLMDFYDEELNKTSTLIADYGFRKEKSGEAVLRNNVILTNVKGEKMETEELIWKEKEKKIFGEKKVTITTKNEQIIGAGGFESNQEFTHYKINKIIDSKILVAPKEMKP